MSDASGDMAVVRTIVATPDPPPTGIPNPIHAADGAASAGYRGALVAGVRTYGWVAEAAIEALGASWLDDGWADVTLRRPLFAGEVVTITLTPRPGDTGSDGPAAVWAVDARVAADDRLVLDGTVGRGRASWADTLDPPLFAPPLDSPHVRPVYTLHDAPVGIPLRPLGAFVTAAAATRLQTEDLGLAASAVPEGRIHPWFLAARMSPLTRHNFTYGPTIHVRTQIQHLGQTRSDREVVVGARIVEVHERNDHWYQVLDGVVHEADGKELARLRHHSIFRPRGTHPPAPITT